MGRLSLLDGNIQIARRDGGLYDDHSESPTDFSTALMQKSLWPKDPAIEDSPRLMAAPSHRPSRSFILSAMRRAERRGVRR